MAQHCSLISSSSKEELIGDPSAKSTAPPAVKRNVRMHEQVHVVYEDGDSTMETLAQDKFTAGAKKCEGLEKPVGQQVQVEDASKATNNVQCAQQ